ncbi:MAG: sulfatase family protein [Actinomycetota bacterium]
MHRPTMRQRGVAALVATMTIVIVPASTVVLAPATTAAARPRRPNVVFILLDDLRADMFDRMPTLQRRIVAKGMTFTNAFAPNSTCCPSRTSFLSGDYSHTTGVWGNKAPFGGFDVFDDSRTLATRLDAAGFRTGLFGKYLNGYSKGDAPYIPPGWDRWWAHTSGGSVSAYYGFDVSDQGRYTVYDHRHSTRVGAEQAAQFISSTPRSRPFFLMWTPLAPHQPAQPEPRYEGRFQDIPPLRPPSYDERDMSDKSGWLRDQPPILARKRRFLDQLRIDMYETLLTADDGVEILLHALGRRISNTIIVFAGDNGFAFGEHRLQGKPFAYDAVSSIPFVVRYDPLTGKRRSTNRSVVANIDLAPTISALTGAAHPDVDGLSLVPVLAGRSRAVRNALVLEHLQARRSPAYCATRTKSWLYVDYGLEGSELYDYRKDPYELLDRAGRRSLRGRVERMRGFARARCDPTPPGFVWDDG